MYSYNTRLLCKFLPLFLLYTLDCTCVVHILCYGYINSLLCPDPLLRLHKLTRVSPTLEPIYLSPQRMLYFDSYSKEQFVSIHSLMEFYTY